MPAIVVGDVAGRVVREAAHGGGVLRHALEAIAAWW
jgi:hypothetical protein